MTENGNPLCGSKHPEKPETSCTRLKGHQGEHKAFTFSIQTPESWLPAK